MVIPISQVRKLRVELLVTQPRSGGQPVLQLGLQPRHALYSILALAYCRAMQRARRGVVTVTVLSLSSLFTESETNLSFSFLVCKKCQDKNTHSILLVHCKYYQKEPYMKMSGKAQ